MNTTAAILDQIGGNFALAEVTLGDPAPDEVLFDVVGVGLCHTDLAVREGHLPFPLPGIVGHEGSGIVRAVGSDVTAVAVGDRICASFNSCGSCTECTAGTPSYCQEFMQRNFSGARPDGTSPLQNDDGALGGNFFGQSTFATAAIARERNVVRVPEDMPLDIVGPLGCGIQTGAGAIMNALACEPGSSLLVTGGGSVGLAAVLGAVVQGVGTIIVLEPVAARRELALELGATHALDPADGPLQEQVRGILPEGVNYALDTTAHLGVLAGVVSALSQRGHLGMVGVPSDPEATFSFSLLEAQARGLSFTSIVEGNSNPASFIPELFALHHAGRFPFEKMITRFPFDRINEAIAAQASGSAVKVVLVHE
ncbi:NAD(P)-dependent alcohol dehydrogenase [Arthrobacter rhombi]|uniref:NAD(P)-dependent alcohol dehydrogenase n=1 Tax=Arthrobacter rhombi TaxID=71253 RepID=UPI0031D50F0A